MDNKIVEKIQKLLQLSKSSNENEAKVAMMKAQELLVKHKLALKDVEGYKNLSDVVKNRTGITYTKAKWKGILAKTISENFGCHVYTETYRTRNIVFLGREEDVDVCNIILEYAIDIINKEAQKMKNLYKKQGMSNFTGLVDDFANGFIRGLGENFEKQKAKHQEWGLVLTMDSDVQEAYKNLKLRSGGNYRQKSGGFQEAYAQGKKEGLEFSISDKVACGSSTLELS